MKGTQGGSTVAINDRYLLKFLLLSIVISHAAKSAMYLWPTCSHVLFRRRIGGVFSPEVIAIIVEKLFNRRQRWSKGKGRKSDRGCQHREGNTYVRNVNKMLNGGRSPPRIILAKDKICNPHRNLHVRDPPSTSENWPGDMIGNSPDYSSG
jgi:hypothetical protein